VNEIAWGKVPLLEKILFSNDNIHNEVHSLLCKQLPNKLTEIFS